MAHQTHRPTDSGFTLVEVLVALALISTLMASLTTYFVQSTRVSRSEAQTQAADRLAQTGMERARGFGGLTLLVGRAQCGSCLPVSGYDNGLTNGMTRWDATVSGVAPVLPIPTEPSSESEIVNGIRYSRYYFLGKCYPNDITKTCDSTGTTTVPMVKLVVAVTWSESKCPEKPFIGRVCIVGATALFSGDPSDPVFTQ